MAMGWMMHDAGDKNEQVRAAAWFEAGLGGGCKGAGGRSVMAAKRARLGGDGE